MNRLTSALAEEITKVVTLQLRSLPSEQAELRAVFNGPPRRFLERIFEGFASQGGLKAALGEGREVTVPVLLLQDSLPEGTLNPPIGVSGICDHNHVLSLRNSPSCPRFLILSAPGSQSNLSQNTTW